MGSNKHLPFIYISKRCFLENISPRQASLGQSAMIGLKEFLKELLSGTITILTINPKLRKISKNI